MTVLIRMRMERKRKLTHDGRTVAASTTFNEQISQLQINPPIGVTVPEYLAAYFESVNNSSNTALPGDTNDQEAAETEEEMQVVGEQDLLTMTQKNLLEQYREQEVAVQPHLRRHLARPQRHLGLPRDVCQERRG